MAGREGDHGIYGFEPGCADGWTENQKFIGAHLGGDLWHNAHACSGDEGRLTAATTHVRSS